MNPNQSHHDLPDHDVDLENDAVWNLLENTSPREASPRFVQDTLRRLRLESVRPKTSWWKSLLAPKLLLGTAGAAIAAVAILTSLPSPSNIAPENHVTALPTETQNWVELEHAVASELLSDAADDPSLLSDAEIIALLL